VPVAKLKKRNGIIHCEGRLPLPWAESLELKRAIEIIKQEIMQTGGGENS
jgi:hypothetical protein